MLIEKQNNDNNNKNNNNNLYNLSFIKENNHIIGNNFSKSNEKISIKNGKIKLDFNKYDYLLALSSRKCSSLDTMYGNCGNTYGWEFEISFQLFNWKYVRLLWIAYLKNENNKQCLFTKLPKEIINKIVTFVTC